MKMVYFSKHFDYLPNDMHLGDCQLSKNVFLIYVILKAIYKAIYICYTNTRIIYNYL